jgi:N-acetylglucosaminyldiphosphoundecaprenol N-acetyl-beta-D-mannosaminyltransferase
MHAMSLLNPPLQAQSPLGDVAPVLGFPVTMAPDCHSLAERLFRVTTHPEVLQAGAVAYHPHAWHVVTANPEVLMHAQAHPETYGVCLQRADAIFPDGMGVAFALKHQGHQQAVRLPGIELASALLALAEAYDKPVALFGGSPEVQPELLNHLKRIYPRLRIVMHHHGFLSPESPECMHLVETCAKTVPWLVLVALGCPKQDEWITRYRPLFDGRTLMMGVGGSFDVWAGAVQRAPQWVQRCHAEWVWRLASQPWRVQRAMPALLRFAYQIFTDTQKT